MEAVMAHELGHFEPADIKTRVLMARIYASAVVGPTCGLAYLAFFPLGVPLWEYLLGWLAFAPPVSILATAATYRAFRNGMRNREFAADAFAARYVGGHEMALALRKLSNQSKQPSGVMGWIKTLSAPWTLALMYHPKPGERIAALEAVESRQSTPAQN
jgi:Zn-dependent protease with chaperone function